MPTGAFQVYIFKSVRILACMFHVKYWYKNYLQKGKSGAGARVPQSAQNVEDEQESLLKFRKQHTDEN